MNRREALIGAVTAALGAGAAQGLVAGDVPPHGGIGQGDLLLFYYPMGALAIKQALDELVIKLHATGDLKCTAMMVPVFPGDNILPCLPWVQLLSQSRVSAPTLRIVERPDEESGLSFSTVQQLLSDGQWHDIPVVKEEAKV